MTIRSLLSARTEARDLQIRRFGASIDVWTRGVQRHLLGILAVDEANVDYTLGQVDRLFRQLPQEAADVLERGLGEVWRWSRESSLSVLTESLPWSYWIARVKDHLRRRGVFHEDRPPRRLDLNFSDFDPEDLELQAQIVYQRILDGKVTRAQAKALLRKYEFPAPSVAKIRRVLTTTNARDGLSAMQRIKTVMGPDLDRLRLVIQRGLSAPPEEKASGLDWLSKQIRPFFADQEGINYKARRIARTESVRVAEEGLREGYEEVADAIGGIQWFSARLPQSRPDHVARHEKIYWQTKDGDYVAEDGESLPPIPLGPNCLCWTSPVWKDYITAGAPPADYGPQYRASAARAEREKAAILAKT